MIQSVNTVANAAYGDRAMWKLATGNENTALGSHVLSSLLNGSRNTVI